MSFQDKCIVIGGGVGGCLTALELADAGYQVEIIEKEQKLMKCSSAATPGRMGLGFHYADLNTALFYLRATVHFTRQYGQFRDAVDKPVDHPLRRGRYFILKSSCIPPEVILNTYKGIQQEYAKMVAEDPDNEVFGPPQNLYRVLEKNEYMDDTLPEIVEYGIETAEELLDWTKFRKHIIEKIEDQAKRIKVHLGTEVIQIQAEHEHQLYTINCVNKDNKILKSTTKRLVNCTWENIAALNSTCNLRAKQRMNRLKVIATIRLPPEMEDAPSMFFCMGPHCMFSNKGNGIGMITYAPVTNIGFSSAERMPLQLEEIHLNMTDDDKRLIYGEKIIQGVSSYIPKLAFAKILKVKTGIVQTYINEDHFDFDFVMGDTNILHDPSSNLGIFYRDYYGVEVLAPGFVVNACMKLLFCVKNAEVVREIFETSETCKD